MMKEKGKPKGEREERGSLYLCSGEEREDCSQQKGRTKRKKKGFGQP